MNEKKKSVNECTIPYKKFTLCSVPHTFQLASNTRV